MRKRKHEGPLRVAFFDHTAKIGGGEIALANLIRNIDRSMVYPIVLLSADGPLVERLRGEAEVHVLPLEETVAGAAKDSLGWRSLFRLQESIATLRYIRKVSAFLREMQIDLIHTNSLKADIIGGIAAKRSRIPVVWHVRDRIEPDYLPGSVVRIFRVLSRILPDFVIANSAATLKTIHLGRKRQGLAIPSGVVLEERTRVVHDGYEVEAADQNVDSGPVRRVGLVGRISPWKGQHIFIQAAAIVHQEFPKLIFEIIGAALFEERAYEQQLHDLCASLGLTNAVKFAGFVEQVSARIAQLEIIVHASTTGEPFGQVIIEGMAAAKPVVATNGGGVPEIVQDGVTGLLVPMGDARKMAEAILYLLKNPELGEQMGARGRVRALDQFTIHQTARKVEAVYKEVLAYAPG
jgi:glycosyltransferase involved in cell wall biosynthesis